LDYFGTRALLPSMPAAGVLLADRGYDAEWFRANLIDRGITPCIPMTKAHKLAISHKESLYRQRNRIENMFGRLRDWRRIATRYDRCADLFLSACAFIAVMLSGCES
jgi:transposase